MPAFVPAHNVVQLNSIMVQAGEKVENTFHYLLGVTPTASTMTAMANTYLAWWTANVGLFSHDVFVQLIYLRDLSSQFATTLEVAPGATLAGTRASQMLPNNVTIAIKRQTGLAGRKNRGRIYWPGITQDELVPDNALIPGTANTMAAALNTLLNNQATGNAAQEVILHKADGTTTPVTSYVCSDYFLDSQRRRLPGHNRHR